MMTDEEIIQKYNELMAKRERERKLEQLNNKVNDIEQKYDNAFYSVDAKLVFTIVNMGEDGNHPCSHREEVFPLSKDTALSVLNFILPHVRN